jgi:hypothetical protein
MNPMCECDTLHSLQKKTITVALTSGVAIEITTTLREFIDKTLQRFDNADPESQNDRVNTKDRTGIVILDVKEFTWNHSFVELAN